MSAENLFGTENDLHTLGADLESAETTEDGLWFLTFTLIVTPPTIGLSVGLSC